MSWRWLKVTLWVGFGALALIALYFGGIYLQVTKWCPTLEVKSYTECTDFSYDVSTEYSLEEIRALIDSDFQIMYIYQEKNLHCGARTHFQFRLVQVDKRTTSIKSFYAYALAHELTHLKYMNGNECWTEFEAWKYLYESDNEFLHNVGLKRANEITQGRLQDEYDCGYWINLYLKGGCQGEQ